jgi:hypothetical protein
MSETKTPAYRFFISYRRDDQSDFVEHIRTWFAWRHGRSNVFMDFDSIPVGTPFPDYIREQIERCDALLAIIGPQWVDRVRAEPHRDDDWVRVEIRSALELSKLVVPICIKGAKMPRNTDLQPQLRGMLNIQAAYLDSGPNFIDTIQATIASIEELLSTRAAREREIQRMDEFSPASGLALGYYVNFVKPLGSQLLALDQEIGPKSSIVLGSSPQSGEQDRRIDLEPRFRPHVKLQIIIPPRADHLKPDAIAPVLRRMKPATVRIKDSPRPFGVMARRTGRHFHLIDFPTPLTVLEYGIQRRLKELGHRPQSEEARRIERDELDRFEFALNFWVGDQANEPEFRDRVQVIPYRPDNPEVQWLSNYWS